MKAITVIPGKANSTSLGDFTEPDPSEGSVLVDTIAVGLCGTDIEIVAGGYGWAPDGHERLVLGHESIGRVREAPAGANVSPGDYVVGIVRRPDPVPCYNCAAGEWDFCRNGKYTEHGIKSLDGFMREQYRAEPDALVVVDEELGSLGVLLEPTSVVAKAWEQAELVGKRATFLPKVAVVTGAGPIGLLAAMIGVQKGLEVHVFDQMERGLKPDLVGEIGATYHTGTIEASVEAPDVILECTGVPSLVFDAIEHIGPGGVVCLTGVSPTGRQLSIDAGLVNRSMVLANEAVVGSVNANRRHYEQAADALSKAPASWLGKLVSRKVQIDDFAEAFDRQPDDVKVVIEIFVRLLTVGSERIADGVIEIDTMLGGFEKMTAGYLVEGPHPVLVETGSQSSVETLLAALGDLGVGASDLAGIAVTHIHLDHAGGVGDIARAFPDATVYVHEKGARHLADPTRLVDSAARVYGPLLDSLYGRLDPTPPERLHVLSDEEEIDVGNGRTLRAIDSPGHAKHHLGLLDSQTGMLFAGDAVGVRLPGGGVLRPATPPPDFDLEQALQSLRSFADHRPSGIALAHYGLVAVPPEDLLSEAAETLTAWAEVAAKAWREGQDIAAALGDRFAQDLDDVGEHERARLETLNGVHSNAAGLRRWLEQKGEPAAGDR